jgi:predicted 3-demethylubiquinone-9 3-methyltransferase (glyoxalase superfamily)
MPEIVPCLWFADEAEEAAKFYVSLLPDFRVDKDQHSAIAPPGDKAGWSSCWGWPGIHNHSRGL